MYNAKNYTEQGGEKTIIGGEIEILPGAKIKADNGATVEGFGGGGGGASSLPEMDASALVWDTADSCWKYNGQSLGVSMTFVHSGETIYINDPYCTISKGAVIDLFTTLGSGCLQTVHALSGNAASVFEVYVARKTSLDASWSAKKIKFDI